MAFFKKININKLFSGPTLVEILQKANNRFSVVSALTVVVAIATLGLQLVAFEPGLNNYLLARQSAHQALQGLTDQETGLRAYLITHDPKLLDPYFMGQKEVEVGNLSLDTTLGADSSFQDSIIQLRLAQQKWESSWAQDAYVLNPEIMQDGKPTADFILQGKTLLDNYRALNSDIVLHINNQIDALQSNIEKLLASFLILEVLLVIVSILFNRVFKTLIKQKAKIPLTNLRGDIEKTKRSNYDAPIIPAGPDDIFAIGSSVEDMRIAFVVARDTLMDKQLQLTTQATRLSQILQIAQNIAGSLNLEYVLSSIYQGVGTLTESKDVRLWTSDETGKTYSLVYEGRGVHGRPLRETEVEVGEGVIGEAVKKGRTISQLKEDTVNPNSKNETYITAVPMIVGARVIGVIEFCSDNIPNSYVLEGLATLASHAATAIDAARLHSVTEALSNRDPLTNLYNRRKFEEDARAELTRHIRHKHSMCLFMIDVDNFKTFNDQYGHQKGDEVLQGFSKIAQQNLRGTDGIYRYGGEEFIVILPETELNGGMIVAEKLRSTIEKKFSVKAEMRPVTISIGVAVYPDNATDIRALIDAADAALYEAKEMGRNCVKAYATL